MFQYCIMKFFTTDKIILLSLIAIIGLAIIICQNRVDEGYDNRRTRWVKYMEKVDPIIRQINYFSGNKTKLVSKATKRECKISDVDMDCIYVTNYVRSGVKEISMYEGVTISEAQSKDLIDELTKPEIVNARLKKTQPVIDDEINAVLNKLIEIVGRYTYNTEIPKLLKSTEVTDVKNTDKTQLLDDIAFFSKLGDITPAKASELYTKIWTLTDKDGPTVDSITYELKGLVKNDYELKISIRREIEYFRTNRDSFTEKMDLSEPKVAEIYAKLYLKPDTAGLHKIANDYLNDTTIRDYAAKKKQMETSEKKTDVAYNANVVDVTYHESADDIRARDGTNPVPIKDANGEIIGSLPWDMAVKTTPRYNESSYFRFSPSPYVPNYEDSIYLSRLTRYDDKSAQVTDYGSSLPPPAGGFCEANKNNSIELETQCGKIGKDACASTSCCVLLGGSKCVAGNESGPTMKANYSDVNVMNRDYYFYQGKCYGNCP
jgi:hypothetical protein